MNKYVLTLLVVSSLVACKKSTTSTATKVEPSTIVAAIATNVNQAIYADLAVEADSLHATVQLFVANPSVELLEKCRFYWKKARAAWEQSEGFLYGPVATDNIDPRIDSWPVDYQAIDVELAGNLDFTVDANIDALDDALKGFHPIEYLLWGVNGAVNVADFTPRQFEFLLALTKNLKILTGQLATQWETANNTAYIHSFTSPTTNNPFYPTYRSVYEEMVNALIGICDELAAGKIGEPLLLQDPSLEESHYSSNSMTDFKNNIISVQNVYLGKYAINGCGLEDFVRQYNLSLDNEIKTAIALCLARMNAITVPFGLALSTQTQQVSQIVAAVEDLEDILQLKLLPLIQTKITN